MTIKIIIDDDRNSSSDSSKDNYKKKYNNKYPKYKRGKYSKKKKKDVTMGMTSMMRAIKGE